MKRLLITLSAFCFLMADPDPVGNWKLSGLKVDYLHITREDATVALTDAYGFGLEVPVLEIPAGILFQRFTNGPFTLPIIDAAQLNLNVNLYPDGTGAIAENIVAGSPPIIIAASVLLFFSFDMSWCAAPLLCFCQCINACVLSTI